MAKLLSNSPFQPPHGKMGKRGRSEVLACLFPNPLNVSVLPFSGAGVAQQGLHCWVTSCALGVLGHPVLQPPCKQGGTRFGLAAGEVPPGLIITPRISSTISSARMVTFLRSTSCYYRLDW